MATRFASRLFPPPSSRPTLQLWLPHAYNGLHTLWCSLTAALQASSTIATQTAEIQQLLQRVAELEQCVQEHEQQALVDEAER